MIKKILNKNIISNDQFFYLTFGKSDQSFADPHKDLDCGHYLGPLEKVCCISGVNVLKAIEAHDIDYIKPVLEKSEFGKALLEISASSMTLPK